MCAANPFRVHDIFRVNPGLEQPCSEISERLRRYQKLHTRNDRIEMTTNNISAIYPLSPLQQGFLYRAISDPDSSSYVVQYRCKLRGQLDPDALRRAWQEVVNRHDILRTAFVWEGVEEPLQVVGTRVTLPWEEHDLSGVPSTDQQQRLEEYFVASRRGGFDPAHAPLMRLGLVRLSEDESVFVWTHHHLVVDGWSTALLMKDVAEHYQAFLNGGHTPTFKPRPYGDYIAWLRQQDLSEAGTYWRRALDGVSLPTPLGVDRSSAPGEEKNYSEKVDSLPAREMSALQAVARRHRLTINTMLEGAWALLLSRYSNSDDVVFGGVVSGRPPELPGVETMIGMFINTVPVRVRVPSGMVLSQWLQELQVQQVEARRYQYSSLLQIQGWANVRPGQPMFESVLTFANYPAQTAGENKEVQLRVSDIHFHERTDLPLTMQAAPGPELHLRVLYDKQRFDDETAVRVLGHLKTILVAMSEGLEGRVGDVPILTAPEREELSARAAVPLHCGPEETVQQLFEACVAANPEAPAISFNGKVLSYAELNSASNQIAHGLRDIAAGKPVAVMLEDSPVQIETLMGIIKAGAPFVCLDPNYPSARVRQIVELIEPACLITDVTSLRLHAEVVDALGLKVVTLEERHGDLDGVIDGARWFETCPTTNPELASTPSDHLYIVFTSGSTGQPKGIMQPHRSFCQYIRWHKDIFGIGWEKRLAQWASITYDASYCKILGALCFGATVCMTTPARRYDPAALIDWVREERINLLHMVPSFSRQLLETVNTKYHSTENPWPDLECLSLAGEALSADLARGWRGRLLDGNHLYNMYGPSECILATYYDIKHLDQAQRSVPIGKAIGGRELIILDDAGRLCPIGLTGEIYIRSPYLTDGYWGRPEDTAKVFMQNPLHNDFHDPVYRTGDLGRWLPDGNVEFRGRRDHQVKIRGVRIEIEEIEYALRRHERVTEAAVASHVYDDVDQQLVGYVVLKGEEPEDAAQLRQFLRELLPEQLIPATFVFLEALPRTRTGKLDRKALPKPDLQRQSDDAFVAPRTSLESVIASIWKDLLKVDQISVEDNFFELGGHSIMATQAVNRIREKCASKLTLRTFLSSPVIADIARHIEAEQQLAEDTKMLQLLESVKQLTADQAGALLQNKRERA